MTTFESQETRICKNSEELFAFFSDLTNIETLKDKIPAEKANKLKDLEYTSDFFSISMPPVGKVGFRIIDRKPFEQVRFTTENLPFALQIQLSFDKQQENETSFKIIAEADINPFLKPMVSKPLQEAVNKMADTFALMFSQI